MKSGLIIGKFMPLHKGHVSLIEFAKKNCDALTIVICYTNKEPISGIIRVKWLTEIYGADKKISIIPLIYDDLILPNTSVSSKEVSELWAKRLSETLDQKPDLIFSSEEYGNFLAEFMNAEHFMFDKNRVYLNISATQIRDSPFKCWDYIPDIVKPYFVKKIAIVGSESTGKSILTEKLADHFRTEYVPEMARSIIEHTESCTIEHLNQIAVLQARTLLNKLSLAHRILFSDTELNITKSYSRFLFNKELIVEDWVEKANFFELYLFLEPDCPYIQDGTRLTEDARNKLSDSHKQQLKTSGVNFTSLSGNWDERFNKALNIIKQEFFSTTNKT